MNSKTDIFTLVDVFRHSGGNEAKFWSEKKQNLEETVKETFPEDNIDTFLEAANDEFNWSPKKERLLQGSPKLRTPGGDLRGWRSEKDVAGGGWAGQGEMRCWQIIII